MRRLLVLRAGTAGTMDEGVEGIISATDFMELSVGAQTIFI